MEEYTPDNRAREAKEKEIEELLTEFARELDANLEVLRQLMGTYITLTPPLKPPYSIQYIAGAQLGKGGAITRKPGNIRLNWRKLFELVPDVTIAGAGAAAETWLIPFAALYVWMKLWNVATIELKEEDAFVICSLWRHRGQDNRIPEDEAFAKATALAKENGLPILTKDRFSEILTKLATLECIELKEGTIWLREWVRTTY